jgi:succinate dehydrogenase/fumarate reductase cytochrome b subunit
MYAIKSYNSPNCIMSEFEEDMKRLKYIKRLIKKYRTSGELKERLILNHIIVLSNVFGTEAAVRMLFYKFDKDDYTILKSFLIFLNFMPLVVHVNQGTHILSADVGIDLKVTSRLKSLLT